MKTIQNSNLKSDKRPDKYTVKDYFLDLEEELKEAGIPFFWMDPEPDKPETTNQYEIRFYKHPISKDKSAS